MVQQVPVERQSLGCEIVSTCPIRRTTWVTFISSGKIRHDSLNDLTDLDRHVHDGSPLSFSEYQTSETRRRIAPATPSPPCAVRSAA